MCTALLAVGMTCFFIVYGILSILGEAGVPEDKVLGITLTVLGGLGVPAMGVFFICMCIGACVFA